MTDGTGAAHITRLLRAWQDGSQDALDRLVPLVYDELHTLASRHLAREWRHDRLQTTVVVNEAYVRLFGQREIDWQNRGHFFGVSAQMMRRVLVDIARRRSRARHGARRVRVPLDVVDIAAETPDVGDASDGRKLPTILHGEIVDESHSAASRGEVHAS